MREYSNVHACTSISTAGLDILEHLLFELTLALNLLTRIIRRRLTVQRQQGAEIEFGCLEELDFTDVDLV